MSIILEKVVLFHLPFGGSITFGHHVPILFVSYKCGYKTGVFASIIYSIVRVILSFKIPVAKSFKSFVLIFILDYIIPYICMGISSVFKIKSLKYRNFNVCFGVVISFVLNLIFSTISGAVLWKEYIPFDINIWLYSLIYNSIYIIPQMIITLLILKSIMKFTSFTTFL